MSSHIACCLSLEQLGDEAVEEELALFYTKGTEHMHVLLSPLQHFSSMFWGKDYISAWTGSLYNANTTIKKELSSWANT